MGDHPDFLEERLAQRITQVSDLPISRHVYALPVNGGTWHDLHDSIVYDRCPMCDHSRMLVADGEMYLDPYVGHRVRLRGAGTPR